MPLRLLPAVEADIPRLAAVDDAAMSDWVVAKAMADPNEPRIQIVERYLRLGWGQNEGETWLKVVDDDLKADDGMDGQIIAAALWKFNQRQEQGAKEAEGKQSSVVDDDQNKASGDDTTKQKPVYEVMQEMGRVFREEFVRGQAHAHLHVLITHPDHQRRGAGKMLVDWGCQKADELGIMSTLAATNAGLRLYQSCGFEIVKEEDLDLRPWGFDEVERRRYLIRPARGTR